MFRSIRLGRAFGIPLFIHPTFFLLPLWVASVSWSEGLPTIVFGQCVLFTIFGCVMLHELGHALMARYFGIATRDITLYPIGGVARLESTGGKPHEELCIALAGPAVNLAIFLLLLPFVVIAALLGQFGDPIQALSGEGGVTVVLAGYLFAVCCGNLFLVLFNLIPAFPMDGGRVLRALLSTGLGQMRATEVAASVGLVLAGGMMLLGLMRSQYSLALVALFVAFAGQVELRALRLFQAQHLAHRRGGDADLSPLQPLPISGPARETIPATDVPVIRVQPMPINPVDQVILKRGPEGFTGFQWDRENQVWVKWVNGRPVEVR